MKKLLLLVSIISFSAAQISGQAVSVYHERSSNSPGCGLAYVDKISPIAGDSIKIAFKAEYVSALNQARIYYTTDGSNPSGLRGVPSGTTSLINCHINCSVSSGSGQAFICSGTLPPQPSGTVMKYLVSAWNSSSGDEIFGNSNSVTSSANATIFSFNVQGTLPIVFVTFDGREFSEKIRIYWASQQESNLDHYEIFHSRNSLQFEKVGSVTALGNTVIKTDYRFDHLQPVIGNNYYKVVAIDRTGRSVSTRILRILFGKNDNSLVVYPNPAADILNIRVVDVVKGEYTIRVVTNNGQLLYSSKINHNGADAVYPIKLPQPLARAPYRLSLANKYQFYRSSFLVM